MQVRIYSHLPTGGSERLQFIVYPRLSVFVRGKQNAAYNLG